MSNCINSPYFLWEKLSEKPPLPFASVGFHTILCSQQWPPGGFPLQPLSCDDSVSSLSCVFSPWIRAQMTILNHAIQAILGLFKIHDFRKEYWNNMFLFSRTLFKFYFCFIDSAKDCVNHNKLENSSRIWNTRPPDLPPEKSICRSRSNSQNWTWNNRLVPNRERSTSRLYIVTLLI